MSYAHNLMQYIDYYLDFQGIQGDMVTQTIIDKDAIARPALLPGGLHGTPRRAGPAQRLLPHKYL